MLPEFGSKCFDCGLFQNVKSPFIQPYGKGEKKVLVVGEAPGEAEDLNGKPWQGDAGNVLVRAFHDLGYDLFRDCVSINAVNCRPIDKLGKNRAPTSREISICRPKVLSVIKQFKPRVILLLGNCAIESVIGHVWKNDLGGITRWHSWTIPDRTFNAWICPTFHPSYIMRSGFADELVRLWIHDLKKALKLINTPLPKCDDEKKYIHIREKITDWIGEIKEGSVIAFDYETTGLKPYNSGHRIVCVSVAVGPDKCFVSPFLDDPLGRKAFREVLANPNIKKMAHNIKFEEMWSRIRLKQPVMGWYWDSMLAAHILDNRNYVTGLKFQVYVNLGVCGYDSVVSKYIERKTKSANDKNKIEEMLKMPNLFRELLVYCGLDSLFEYKIALIQQEKMGYVFAD